MRRVFHNQLKMKNAWVKRMKVRISRFKQTFQRSHGTKGHRMIVDLSGHWFFVENHAGQGGAAGKVRNTTLVRWVPRLVHGVPLIHQWWISYMGIPPMAMITITIRVHWASYRNALFIISCNDSNVHKILPSRTRSTSRCFNIYIRWNPSPFSDLHWSVSKGVFQMWSVRPWNSFEE